VTPAAWVVVGVLLLVCVGCALIGWAACALAGQVDERLGMDE
jgi:hypothetical protein